MKGYAAAALVLGSIILIFGTVFALQGDGVIGGSVMSNNSFWIYAGSVIAVVGVAIAGFGAWAGFRKPAPKSSGQ